MALAKFKKLQTKRFARLRTVRMRPFWFGCIILTWLFLPYESKSQSAGDVFRACISADTAMNDLCSVYLAGFVNGIYFEQANRGGGSQKICLPDDLTGERVKELFEAYMRDYPKLQDQPKLDQPSIIIGTALLRAYPCPELR